MTFRLTRKAEDDLIHIYVEGVRLFGSSQAEIYFDKLQHCFSVLADHPRMARERTELTPPMRIHPCGAHIVIYCEGEEGILVVRIRHHAEDWVSDPIDGGNA